MELPARLELAASEQALSTQQSAKRRRQTGHSLTDQLKLISRSESRGGTQGNLSQALQEASRPVRGVLQLAGALPSPPQCDRKAGRCRLLAGLQSEAETAEAAVGKPARQRPPAQRRSS